MFDAITRLTADGYRYIGMDHFAKADDDSARRSKGRCSATSGLLHQGRMRHGGVGRPGISKIGPHYACNPRELEDWYDAVRNGRLATNRGYTLNADDEMRRYVIMTIMCNFELKRPTSKPASGVNFDETFAYELGKMKPYVKHELVELYPRPPRREPQGQDLRARRRDALRPVPARIRPRGRLQPHRVNAQAPTRRSASRPERLVSTGGPERPHPPRFDAVFPEVRPPRVVKCRVSRHRPLRTRGLRPAGLIPFQPNS